MLVNWIYTIGFLDILENPLSRWFNWVPRSAAAIAHTRWIYRLLMQQERCGSLCSRMTVCIGRLCMESRAQFLPVHSPADMTLADSAHQCILIPWPFHWFWEPEMDTVAVLCETLYCLPTINKEAIDIGPRKTSGLGDVHFLLPQDINLIFLTV